MFLAGGALSLLVIMWDPLHGQQLALGLMQLQFLVFSLALFWRKEGAPFIYFQF